MASIDILLKVPFNVHSNNSSCFCEVNQRRECRAPIPRWVGTQTLPNFFSKNLLKKLVRLL